MFQEPFDELGSFLSVNIEIDQAVMLVAQARTVEVRIEREECGARLREQERNYVFVFRAAHAYADADLPKRDASAL
jgi:hypothetical protein